MVYKPVPQDSSLPELKERRGAGAMASTHWHSAAAPTRRRQRGRPAETHGRRGEQVGSESWDTDEELYINK